MSTKANPPAATRAPRASAPPTHQKAPQTVQTTPAPTTLPATTSDASTAVALPAEWAAKLAAQAKDVAAKERPSVSKISLRSGIISIGGNPVKGNALPCVILVAGHRNAYYDKPFDPNNLMNPVCFALALDDEGMEAHENVPDDNVPGDDPKKERPSPRACDGCEMNAWGSDPRPNSRGKACKETRRLCLLPADAIADAETCAKAEMAIVDIPVTSGKNYSNFVNTVATSANVPPWAVLATMSCFPDAKTQFRVEFTPMRVINDVEVLMALEKRQAEAERLVLLPYDEVASTQEGKMADGAGVAPKSAPAKAKY